MKVSLIYCPTYELDILKEKIRESLNLIGGLEIIPTNAKVFIKLNCVGPFSYTQAITTNPIFIQAVIQLVKEKTNNIIIGDNPATRNLLFTLKKTGIYDIILKENIQVVNNEIFTKILNPNGTIYREFEVSKEMVDVDVMINLPKLKTHAYMYLTCAHKNLFGLIYGLNKAGWHLKASNPLMFANAYNDFYGAILNTFQNKTMIHICDGVVGLEGEGPCAGGSPKIANAILSSFDAISLDRIAIEVAGLDYHKFFMNKIAHDNHLGIGDINKIEVVGDPLTMFDSIKFKPSTNSLSIRGTSLLKYKGLRNLVLEHPLIDSNKCLRCGECTKICPPKAMIMNNGSYPSVKKTTCIRCWCCAEVCPENAIKKSKRPLLGKLLLKH